MQPRNFYESIRHSLAKASLKGIEPSEPSHKPGNMADRIRNLFEPLGGVELEIPPRGPDREPPDFSGPEYGTYDDE